MSALFFGVYRLHIYITTFSDKIHETQVKVKALEDNKKVLELYKKILVQGSKEQQDIEKYILRSKYSFETISNIEKDAKDAGLVNKDGGGIMSVTVRENAEITAYNAYELVVGLHVEGSLKSMDTYLQALENLPTVSYLEKIDVSIDTKINKTQADITLVFIESK